MSERTNHELQAIQRALELTGDEATARRCLRLLLLCGLSPPDPPAPTSEDHDAGLLSTRQQLLEDAAALCSRVGLLRSRRLLLARAASLTPPADALRLFSSLLLSSSPGWRSLTQLLLWQALTAATRCADARATWDAAARLLSEHCAGLPLGQQQSLLRALQAAAKLLPQDEKSLPSSPPPLCRLLRLQPLPPALRPRRPPPPGPTVLSPFLYSPFERQRGEAAWRAQVAPLWVSGEPAHVALLLRNPCSVALKLDSLCLTADDASEVDIDSQSLGPLSLPPCSSQAVALQCTPRAAGRLVLSGLAISGVGGSWTLPFDGGASQVATVVPPLPLLTAELESLPPAGHIPPDSTPPDSTSTNPCLTLLEGEMKHLRLRLRNAGPARALDASLSVSPPVETGGAWLRFDGDLLATALPLPPGADTALPLTLFAGSLQGGGEQVLCLRLAYSGDCEGERVERETETTVSVRLTPGLASTSVRCRPLLSPPCQPGRQPCAGLLELLLHNRSSQTLHVTAESESGDEHDASRLGQALKAGESARMLLPAPQGGAGLPRVLWRAECGAAGALALDSLCEVALADGGGMTGEARLSLSLLGCPPSAAGNGESGSTICVPLAQPVTLCCEACFDSTGSGPGHSWLAVFDATGDDCLASSHGTVLWAGCAAKQHGAAGGVHELVLLFLRPGAYSVTGEAWRDGRTAHEGPAVLHVCVGD
jgi:hypothetical protein